MDDVKVGLKALRTVERWELQLAVCLVDLLVGMRGDDSASKSGDSKVG